MVTFNLGKNAKVNVDSCNFTTTLDLKESDVIEAVNNIATGLNTLANNIHDFVNKIQPVAVTMISKDDDGKNFEISVEEDDEASITGVECGDWLFLKTWLIDKSNQSNSKEAKNV